MEMATDQSSSSPSSAFAFFQPRISVVIPTFKEESGIVNTLLQLLQQTMFTRNEAEVIVADFDPEGAELTKKAIETYFPMPSVRYVRVHSKGIAYARHVGTMNAKGQVIVCFDADTQFSRLDAIELLTTPISDGQVLFTCCDNVFPPNEIDANSAPANYLKACCLIQKTTPICCLEPGLTFSRNAYLEVGGFDDANWAEGLRLTSKLLFQFGATCKREISDVFVWTSARRANMLQKLGLGVFDYTNAIRGNEIHKT